MGTMKYPIKQVGYKHIDWVGLALSTDLPTISKALIMYLGRFMNPQQDVAWPSLSRIRHELGISAGALSKHLNLIESEGWIRRESGGGDKTTRYHISFPMLMDNAIKQVNNELPHNRAVHEVNRGYSRGEQGVVHEVNTNKQEYNKQYNKQKKPPESRPSPKASPVELKTYIDQCKTEDKKPIPDNDKVFDYADSVNIENEWLYLCWLEFVEKNTETKKRQKNWPQTFRNCVRGNWYKLWWMGDDGMVLSSQGKIARERHKDKL